jgi:hypothetical protein
VNAQSAFAAGVTGTEPIFRVPEDDTVNNFPRAGPFSPNDDDEPSQVFAALPGPNMICVGSVPPNGLVLMVLL